MNHLQLLLIILLITGCATAQEDVIYFSKSGLSEKDSIAYFFHDEEGTVRTSGWMTGEGQAMEPLTGGGKHLTFLRRVILPDGSKGGLDIITWQDIKPGSEVYFPDFSEDAYQAPVGMQFLFGNCEGISKAVFSGNVGENIGVQLVENNNLKIQFKTTPADNTLLFVKEGTQEGWKYLEVQPQAGLQAMVDCGMLKSGVRELPVAFPAGSLVQGGIRYAGNGEEILLYQVPPNMEGQFAPKLLLPEAFDESELSYDFLITPAEQRNLFLGRRVYKFLGNKAALPASFSLPVFQLEKEYVTEGGFAVKTNGNFQGILATYGLEVPNNGQTASIRNRSQWKLFGPAVEGRIEITLPAIPKAMLQQLTGSDFVRVYNSVAIHLYQFKERPNDADWKAPAKLLEGNLDHGKERIEYRAWIKELD